MASIILYIATSLDGFIARADGGLDWLDNFPNPQQLDYGYADFLAGIDTAILGRKTYDKVLSFGIDWPYPELTSYVVSRQAIATPSPRTYRIGEDVVDFLQNLKKTSEKDCWLIGGGDLLQTCLAHRLVDRMRITMVPILLGTGIRLFADSRHESQWKCVQAQVFPTGMLQLDYLLADQ